MSTKTPPLTSSPSDEKDLLVSPNRTLNPHNATPSVAAVAATLAAAAGGKTKVKFIHMIAAYIIFFAGCFVMLHWVRPVPVMQFVKITVGNPVMNMSFLPVDWSLAAATTTAPSSSSSSFSPPSSTASIDDAFVPRPPPPSLAPSVVGARRGKTLAAAPAGGGGDGYAEGTDEKEPTLPGDPSSKKTAPPSKNEGQPITAVPQTTREPEFMVPPQKISPTAIAKYKHYFDDVRLTTKTRMICPWFFVFDYPFSYFLVETLNMKRIPGLDANVVSLMHPLFALACVYFLLTSVAEVPVTTAMMVGENGGDDLGEGAGAAGAEGGGTLMSTVATGTSLDDTTSCIADPHQPPLPTSTSTATGAIAVSVAAVAAAAAAPEPQAVSKVAMRRVHSRALSATDREMMMAMAADSASSSSSAHEMRTLLMGSPSGSGDGAGGGGGSGSGRISPAGGSSSLALMGGDSGEVCGSGGAAAVAAVGGGGHNVDGAPSSPTKGSSSSPPTSASVAATTKDSAQALYNTGQTRVLHYPSRLRWASLCLLLRNFLDTFDGVLARAQRQSGIAKRGLLKNVDGHMIDATADTLGVVLVFISIFFILHRRRLLLDPFVARLLSRLNFQIHKQRPLQMARIVAFVGVLGTIASIGALWESFVRKYVPLFEPNVVRYAPDLVPVENKFGVRVGLFLWSVVCGDALLFLMVFAMACDLLWETAQYLCFIYLPFLLAILIYNIIIWNAVVLSNPIAAGIWTSLMGPATGL